jgi:hypothetical protein
MKVIGIDPGKKGGIAITDGDEVSAMVMPMDENDEQDGKALYNFFSLYQFEVKKVFIEMPGLRPRESPHTALTIGIGFGKIVGALMAVGIPYEIVHPKTWSNKYPHGVLETDIKKRKPLIKKARAEIVAKMYPGIDLRSSSRSTFFHDGMVDSVLIADYGWGITKNSEGVL